MIALLFAIGIMCATCAVLAPLARSRFTESPIWDALGLDTPEDDS